jgi:phytoene dehydrogenase-like protein
MGTPKGFSDRIETWLAKIPGIRTYRDREHRRETDKQLRENLAARLQETRNLLKRLILNISQKGDFNLLAEMDRLSSHLQQMADTIRYASYGYGGIFDLEKIREEELNQLYTFDLSLMEDLDGIQAQMEEMVQEASPEIFHQRMRQSESLLDAFEKKFRKRSDFLARPA